VTGATGIAASLGIDTYVIGALVVAIGTSLPELVTVVLSRLRGHDDIGVGTLIGSNLFNGLAIVGVAATIHPIEFPLQEIAITLTFGMAALLLLPPTRRGITPRQRCLLLFAIYGIFIWPHWWTFDILRVDSPVVNTLFL
jgi:cation:H+ antiporter